MKRRTFAMSLVVAGYCVLLSVPTKVVGADFDDSVIAHIAYPEWFRESFLDLEGVLEEVRASDKQGLMILFTTEGCSYCDKFIRKSLGDPKLAGMVQKNLYAIGLEIFDDNELTAMDGTVMAAKEFAKQAGADFSPTLVFLNRDGELLLRLVGYLSPEKFSLVLEFLGGGHYQNMTLREYAVKRPSTSGSNNPDKPLNDDPLFTQPPYMLDRSRMAASVPLLVLFEEKNCIECEQFHDQVLADPEIRKRLAKFEIVRLDMRDKETKIVMPDGSRGTPVKWFSQSSLLQTPAMLFYDEKGNEVLRTDALVLNQRMMNSLNFVLEKAYKKGWTYQRFARTKSLDRMRSQQ